MFTGIIEHFGEIISKENSGSNISFKIKSTIASQLKIDESVSHNGICLTVESIENDNYTITAVHETVLKTNISYWKSGDHINLERAMVMNGRLDGHIVQGHVDDAATCIDIKDLDGSFEFTFSYNDKFAALVIEKGSICINGVSLTAYDLVGNSFKVSIIPYTYKNTNFNTLKINDLVNVEFDILGKYVQRILSLQ